MGNKLLFALLASAAILACKPEEKKYGTYTPPEPPVSEDGLATYMLCDFDTRTTTVEPVNCTYNMVDNPVKSGINTSAKVGKAVLKGGTWDCVLVEPTRPLVFLKDPAVFKVKVISPAVGRKVYMQVKSTYQDAPEKQMVFATTTQAGKWEELVFDFRSLNLVSNWYNKLYILFDGNEKVPNAVWYFDDVWIPDDDISAQSLFKREGTTGMLMDGNKKYSWMSNSIANPGILTPDESMDGEWWLYTRGGDGTYGSLGVFTQSKQYFNPKGGWVYYDGNPIVPHGFHSTADGRSAIDPCPIVGDDGKLYLFYKGMSGNNVNTVLIATSTDGYHFTKVEKPWKENCGVADVVKWNGSYYLFVSRRCYRFTNILSGDDAVEFETVQRGDGPDGCDHYSINGQKLLHLDNKWFMIYQASPCHDDFPDRFHVAYSDDLEHWTKVQNHQPLFTRGARGQWDQGAIWAPDTFEYNGNLIMYYEGWGQVGQVKNRDKKYFTPAHSAIGVATCSKEDFLKWCGLAN